MTYEDLIQEKEKLLEKKEENENRIKEIDSKIEYYEWCYNNCLWYIDNYQKKIINYKKLIKYNKRTRTLFDMSNIFNSSQLDGYCENRIIDFETEIKKLEKDAEKIKQVRKNYIILRYNKLNENIKIESRIEEIEKTTNSKEKVLTKGAMKNDRYQTN